MLHAVSLGCATMLTVVLSGVFSGAGPQSGPTGPAAVTATSGTQLAGTAAVSAAASCPAAPYGARFYAPGSGKTVALTFDDGPGRSTAAILGVLARYRVPATFFNVGVNVAARPGVVRDEVRHGYPAGNHTWSHSDMRRLSAARQATEMDRMSAGLKAVTGTVPCAFRPPSGNYNAVTLRLARQRRMGVWLWSVDPRDWMAHGSGSSYWVSRIVRLAEQEGGKLRHPIVLMHDSTAGNPATVAALPTVIKFFRSRGYRFVTL